jgi:hypothetical protein
MMCGDPFYFQGGGAIHVADQVPLAETNGCPPSVKTPPP